jgi:transcription termination factor Rho
MAKKRFRPRSGGGGGSGGRSGGYGGGYYNGNGGGGGGRGGSRGGRRRSGGGMDRPQRRPFPSSPIEGMEGEAGEPQPEVVLGPDGEPLLNEEGVAITQMPPEVQLIDGVGMLEMHPNGYGFMRSPENNYSRERSDPFVPGTMIERYGLRQGVMLHGMVQPGRKQQGPRLRELIDVDGMPPEEYLNVKSFDQLTPINPERWYKLETGATPLTTRVMDLLTPLGRGQRALIVAPPRSGKTFLLQHISQGIATNHPDVKLIVLLIDERPEEVTDMQRNVKGEVIASSLDMDVESHVRLSQFVIDRCKRLAEMGKDVFLLMDSITRLARAFNKWVGNTGRTMSGGVDIKAMDIPKKLFATARCFEEGGSLTIVGTALIETGSRMDDLIFQEFKGTGNMELVLDRRLADRRVWPAIDISQSGTRREELLLPPDTLHAVTMLRRTLNSMNPTDAMEQLTKQLSRFKSNDEFITLIRGKAMND